MTCATRLTKLLDLCYGSIKGAYKSLRRALLGASDNNVYLVPSYKPVLKRHKPERRLVLVWSEESIQRLQDCCASTDWDLFMRVWMNPQRPYLIMLDFVRTQSSIKDQSPFFPTINHGSLNQSNTFVIIKEM